MDSKDNIITEDFAASLRDYAFLLNRSYPRKSILKIVGDRYMLNAIQRVLLARGVFPDRDADGRAAKTRTSVSGKELHIDAYNVFFTICNYLLGRMVFVANDGFLRDTGEVWGKPQDDPVLARGIGLCMDYLEKHKPSGVEFLLDSPVSHSAELAGELRRMINSRGIIGDAAIDKNPDALLMRRNSGIIVSSDSDILDHTGLDVLDLAHLILADNFSLDLPDLGSMLS